MEKQLLVNRVKRYNHSIISESSIGNKLLFTPSMIPKINNELDLKVICDSNLLEKELSAICFNIATVSSVISYRKQKAKQFDLTMKSTEEKTEQILATTPIMIDPMSEVFYYDLSFNNNQTYRDRITRLDGFPSQVAFLFNQVNSNNRDTIWKEIRKQNLILALVNWYIKHQIENNANIVIPPSPVLDGKSLKMLDILHEINTKTNSIVMNSPAISNAISGYYLPLHYNAIKKDGFLDLVYNKLSEVINYQKAIFLKILWYNNLDDKKYVTRLSDFLTKIDELKRDLDDNFLVFLLDGTNEGFYSLANGVDSYVEPLGGIIKPRGRKKVSEEEKEVDETLGIKKTKHYGRYYDKEDRAFISFKDLLELTDKNDGKLPCDCIACKKYHNKLTSSLGSAEWNIARRAHLINARAEEIDRKLIKGIQENDLREIYFQASRDNNRNFVYLLPKEYRRT